MRTNTKAASGIAEQQRIAVVGFPADVDQDSVLPAREKALVLLNRGVKGIVLDFSATAFCDSSGINAVFRIEHRAKAAGAVLRLAVPPDTQMYRAFELIGMSGVVPLLPTVAAAVADLERGIAESAP